MSLKPRAASDNNEAFAGNVVFSDPQEVLLSMRDILGRKWHPIILYYLLSEGTMRFSSLKDHINGVSSKMLCESLTDLEAMGLVSREKLATQSKGVEYSLTEQGESLEALVTEMVRWGTEHDPNGDDQKKAEEPTPRSVPSQSSGTEGE